jgi:hypothetical protein
MKSAIEQHQKCAFECDGGPIDNNDAWRWLVRAANVGPEFWPGQGVWFEVNATVAGMMLSDWRPFTVVGCVMSSNSNARCWTYSLSNDPPEAYHFGKTQFAGVNADKLRTERHAAHP